MISPASNSTTQVDPIRSLRDPLFLLIIGLLWLGIGYTFLLSPSGYFVDSVGYLESPVSFIGDSQRAWPTVLLFDLLPTNTTRLLSQSVLYGLVWTALLSLAATAFSGLLRISLLGFLVALALTPLFLGWNLAILAEGLTSVLVLTGFLLVMLAVFRPQHSLLFIALGGLLFSIASVNRLPVILLLVPFFVFPFLTPFRSHLTPAKTFSALALLIVLALYPLWYNQRTNEWWSTNMAQNLVSRGQPADGRDSASGLSRSGFNFFVISSENYGETSSEFSDLLFASVVDQVGPCINSLRASSSLPDTPLTRLGLDPGYRPGFEAGRDPFVSIPRVVVRCPGATRWLNTEFDRHYLRFVISEPLVVARHLLWSFRALTLTGVQTFVPVNSILPAPVELIYESVEGENGVNTPLFAWLFISLLLSIGVLWRRVYRTSPLWLPLALISLATLMAILFSNLLMSTDSVRIAAPLVLLLYVSTLFLIAESLRLLSSKATPGDSRLGSLSNP